MKRPKKHKKFREYIIPSVIKIGYQDVKVSEADLIDAQGVFMAEQSEIRIKQGMDSREQLNTVLHEILHAIIYSYGLKKDFKDDDEEEGVVNALGNGLTEALVRNPPLVKFINSALT